jgi:hypothetical protein
MVRAYRLSEVRRRERSETPQRLHADPEFAARHAAAAGERMRRLHADPEFATRQAAAASATLRRLNADPAFAARNAAASRERMTRRHADPEFKKRLLNGIALGRERRRYGDYWKKGEPHPGF